MFSPVNGSAPYVCLCGWSPLPGIYLPPPVNGSAPVCAPPPPPEPGTWRLPPVYRLHVSINFYRGGIYLPPPVNGSAPVCTPPPPPEPGTWRLPPVYKLHGTVVHVFIFIIDGLNLRSDTRNGFLWSLKHTK